MNIVCYQIDSYYIELSCASDFYQEYFLFQNNS